MTGAARREQPLGAVVVGTGFFGKVHARAYARMRSVRLVGVVDVVEERARLIAAELSCEYSRSLEEMLRRDDVDLVSVVTPEALHREVAVTAAAAGKHVFVEKPIATTLEDAAAITRAASDAGVKLSVGFESRFGVPQAQAKQAVDSGMIGRLVHVFAKRRADRGFADLKQGRVTPILESAIHDIDMFLWLASFEEVIEVTCVGARGAVFERWGVPDWVVVNLRTASGCLGTIDCGWGLPASRSRWRTPASWHGYSDLAMEVMGTQGAVYVDLSPMLVRAIDEQEGWKFPDTVYWPELRGRVGGAVGAELEDFVACIARGGEPLVTGGQATEVLRVALRAEEALTASMG